MRPEDPISGVSAQPVIPAWLMLMKNVWTSVSLVKEAWNKVLGVKRSGNVEPQYSSCNVIQTGKDLANSRPRERFVRKSKNAFACLFIYLCCTVLSVVRGMWQLPFYKILVLFFFILLPTYRVRTASFCHLQAITTNISCCSYKLKQYSLNILYA